jgi:hypothetical protein
LKNAYYRRDTYKSQEVQFVVHKKNHHSTPGCHDGQFPINKTPTF